MDSRENKEQGLPKGWYGAFNEETGNYILHTDSHARDYRRTKDAECARIRRLMENGFACMSAYLPENDIKTNTEQQWALMELLREEETRHLVLMDVWQDESAPEGEHEAAQLAIIPFRPGAMEEDAFEADAARWAKQFGIPAYLMSPPGESDKLYRMEWNGTAEAYARIPVSSICCDSVEELFSSIRRGLGKDMEGWRHLFNGYIYPTSFFHAMALYCNKYEYALCCDHTGINVDHAPREGRTVEEGRPV